MGTKAVKEYGIASNNTVMNEIKQMVDKVMFEHMQYNMVPKGVNVLNSHMFLKVEIQ